MSTSLAIFARMVPLDASSGVPRHLQIRNALRAVIERHFADGEKFFTETELGARLPVSQGTLRRALLDLAREGLLERRVAKGTFVRKGASRPGAEAIAVFAPSLESSFWADLLEALAAACRAAGERLDIHHTHRGQHLAVACAGLDQARSGQRAILLGDQDTVRELHRVLDQRGCRTVVVDAVVPGHRGPGVRIDNAAGMRLGIDHLAGLGHRRVALLVNEPVGEGSVAERVAAFRAALRAHAIAGAVVDCGVHAAGPGARAFDRATAAMPRVWALEPRPTALFCVSDPGAWAALKWCAQRGIAVPGQLSILGFDDDRPSRYTFPALSTVAQPLAALAAAALAALAPAAGAPRQAVLSPTLIVRESTGRPPRSPT
jgi:LacI family transcriptional regulator